MKKKNLAILLIMPFLIALFGIATIKTAFNIIDNDVVGISWEYAENELFVLGSETQLRAKTVLADERYPASEGNELVWTVENADDDPIPHARIEERSGDGVYLVAESRGDIRITCGTSKGNVMPMSMTGLIGSESDLMSINDAAGGSGQNVDPVKYYGEYDLVGGLKQPAVITLDIKTFSKALLEGLEVAEHSSNLTVDLPTRKITIRSHVDGTSFVTLRNPEANVSRTFSFKTVKDGVNVYTYDDLLDCTNRSEKGEVVVLRRNFVSRKNVGTMTSAEVFGKDLGSEVYRFDTTYNSEYIEHWNKFAAENTDYSPVSKSVIAGIRVQKDLYGNGFTLDLHDLCYPSQRDGTTENATAILGPDDLFRGPKPFYLLGDPNNMPLVTAYGQDNIGIYIDGDNITVNDVKVRNCDFGTIIQNLEYTGTVVEVHGDGNRIANSVLSNGKTVLRSFSSEDLSVDNCILQYARNFLLLVGSNEYVKNPDERTHKFLTLDGNSIECTLDQYLEVEGDKLLGYLIAGFPTVEDIIEGEAPTYSKDTVKEALHLLQDALSRSDAIAADDMKGSTKVTDTSFYYGGVASVGIDTMFNGPFLYSNKPSMIENILSIAGAGFKDMVIPTFPPNVAGSSYPVSLELAGNTRFYYDKTLEDWDISGLIGENIGKIVNNFGGSSLNVDIDDIFPLKTILRKVAEAEGSLCNRGGKSYLNIPVAFYGGGTNNSTLIETSLDCRGLTAVHDVDLLDSYLYDEEYNVIPDIEAIKKAMNEGASLSDIVSNGNIVKYIKNVLTKTVTTVMGFQAFKFQFMNDPEGLFDENGKPTIPDFTDLQKNLMDKEKNNG